MGGRPLFEVTVDFVSSLAVWGEDIHLQEELVPSQVFTRRLCEVPGEHVTLQQCQIMFLPVELDGWHKNMVPA